MKMVIGGSMAIVIGIVCLSIFFTSFLTFVAGALPLILVVAGCLTIYLKKESLSFNSDKAECCQETEVSDSELPAIAAEETGSFESVSDKEASDVRKLSGNTGTLVFHSLDCKFSKSQNCTAFFNTRDAALKEGYKPCGICKP